MAKRLCDLTPEERIAERGRRHEYYLKNRDKLLQQCKDAQAKRWLENPDAERMKHRVYYKARYADPEVRERKQVRAAVYYDRHRERIAARSKARRDKDPDAHRARCRAWKAAREDRVRLAAAWLAFGLTLKN